MSEGPAATPTCVRGAIELGSGRRFLDGCRRGSAAVKAGQIDRAG